MIEFIKSLDIEQQISFGLLILAFISFIALKVRQRKNAPSEEELEQEELQQQEAAAEYREMWMKKQSETSNENDE